MEAKLVLDYGVHHCDSVVASYIVAQTMKKYSNNFNEVFQFYFRMRKQFWFAGGELTKSPVQDRNGVDGKRAFFLMESTGKMVPTKHPNLLFALLKSKASANFHIKQYAEDKAEFRMSWIELEEIFEEEKYPQWFQKAVRNSVTRLRQGGWAERHISLHETR